MIRVNELKQMYRTLGASGTCQNITEALQEGHLKPTDFSLRDLAEGLVEDGREWVRSLDPASGQSVMESSGAVDTTAFSNITGQLVINAILAAYNRPGYSISAMFPTVSTKLNGEKIPGIGGIGDKSDVVNEGMMFPSVGVGEDYIETPATDKRGLIVPVTKEAVFFDRTGILLDRCGEVGESLRLNKEKRCIDVLIGKTNNYKWKGTTYNTYQAGASPWANLLAGAANDLVDWTDVDAAEQLFENMLDPNTGEAIELVGTTLVACPSKKHVINRILNATELRYQESGQAVQTLAPNTLSGITGVTNARLFSRLQSQMGITAAQARATWFLGDMQKAFRYMENWPVTVVQAPQNSEAEFNQDIVARFKASERGVPAVWDPRYVVKVNGY
jgi:hypothetical protein